MTLLEKLTRFVKPRPRPLAPQQHAIDPDELMLLFQELCHDQEKILATDDSGLSVIQEGEKIIGHVDRQFTRRLWIFTNFYRRRTAEEELKARYGNEHEQHEAEDNAKRFSQAADALKELAFLAVMQEIGTWKESVVGMRRGWNVVALPPPVWRKFEE